MWPHGSWQDFMGEGWLGFGLGGKRLGCALQGFEVQRLPQDLQLRSLGDRNRALGFKVSC